MLPSISAAQIPLSLSPCSCGTHHQGQGNGTTYTQGFPNRFRREFEAGNERERVWTRFILLTGQGHRAKENPEGVGENSSMRGSLYTPLSDMFPAIRIGMPLPERTLSPPIPLARNVRPCSVTASAAWGARLSSRRTRVFKWIKRTW